MVGGKRKELSIIVTTCILLHFEIQADLSFLSFSFFFFISFNLDIQLQKPTVDKEEGYTRVIIQLFFHLKSSRLFITLIYVLLLFTV